MKVKTLLSTLRLTNYILQDAEGHTLDSDFVLDKYTGESALYDGWRVVKAVCRNDSHGAPYMYITIRQ